MHGDKKAKYARLCGPKTNQTWPFDALRKLGPLGSNSLEMWDVPFDTNSNKIYIAFDSDQSYHFKGRDLAAPGVGLSPLRTVHGSRSKGFKLNYWFESIIHELGGFRQALFYLRDQLLADVRLVTRPTKIPVIKKFEFSKFQVQNFLTFDCFDLRIGCPRGSFSAIISGNLLQIVLLFEG